MQESSICFEELAHLYIDRKLKRGKIKHNTERYYLNHLIRLSEAFGKRPVNEITGQEIDRFFDELPEAKRLTSIGAIATEQLRDIMQQRQLTHKEVSIKAKLNVNTVSLAANRKKVSEASAHKIAEALGIPFKSLFRVAQKEKTLSIKSVAGHYDTCRTLFRFATKMGYVKKNPMLQTESPCRKQAEVNYYQPIVEKHIMQATGQEPLKWQVYIHLLCITGARRGELAGMTWQNINLDAGVIKISRSLLYSPAKYLYLSTPKNDKTRFINIPSATIALLKAYRKDYRKRQKHYLDLCSRLTDTRQMKFLAEINQLDFLFLSERTGLPMYPDALNRWMRKFEQKIGCQHLNPHAFRHTMASILIFKGVDIISISKRLGHAKPSTTENLYGQLIAESEAINTQCIADVLLS